MGKYYGGTLKRWEKLNESDQADLIFDLLNAFAVLKGFSEATEFMIDLFTRDEVRYLSKRLGIAKMLINGKTYKEIQESLRVGQSTISKVAVWLDERGDGFRKVLKRLPVKKQVTGFEGLTEDEKSKRRHPRSNWLELTSERWRNDTVREQDRNLKRILRTLDSKDVIRHRVDEYYEEANKNNK